MHVGSLEIHEEGGKIVLKSVRVHPHTLPSGHPKAFRKLGQDGLVEAVELEEMPVDLFKENHKKVEPAPILIFKGACVFYGGAWHY
jgi:hypothetical protein